MDTVLLLPATPPQVAELTEAICRHEPGLVMRSGFESHDDATLAGVSIALGFSVRGWRRDGTPLAYALADAQVVVNTLPLTPQTAGLLDARTFAAMPRGAYLVNLARGGHVVEADLIAAVQSGHLSGAALDVQRNEPLPPDDPLWEVPGISLTPHIAAQPDHATVAAQFVANLRRMRAGQPLLNTVDRSRGY